MSSGSVDIAANGVHVILYADFPSLEGNCGSCGGVMTRHRGEMNGSVATFNT
jgi:hypothetical protein